MLILTLKYILEVLIFKQIRTEKKSFILNKIDQTRWIFKINLEYQDLFKKISGQIIFVLTQIQPDKFYFKRGPARQDLFKNRADQTRFI